jgi:hypothetical protein
MPRQGLACREYQPREEPKLEPPKLPYLWLHDVAKLMAWETMRDKRAGRIQSAWESCLGRYRLFSSSATLPRGVMEYAVSSTEVCRALDETNQLLVEPVRSPVAGARQEAGEAAVLGVPALADPTCVA